MSKPLEKVYWDPSNIVVDALKYHATMGDIQTAACVLTVLGERRKSLKSLDESTQEHWLLGYIELLNRYKLWNIATEVIILKKSYFNFLYFPLRSGDKTILVTSGESIESTIDED